LSKLQLDVEMGVTNTSCKKATELLAPMDLHEDFGLLFR
jgi:hypothetical protein